MSATPKPGKVMDREFLGSKCQLATAPDTSVAANITKYVYITKYNQSLIKYDKTKYNQSLIPPKFEI